MVLTIFGIDFARQNVVHDFHRGLVGDALALDEIRLQPGLFHRAGDGFAAAVDDDGIDFNGFEKNDVARDAVADVGVGRVHETAAVFDDEGRAAEFLDVRQRFQQRRRLWRSGLARGIFSSCRAPVESRFRRRRQSGVGGSGRLRKTIVSQPACRIMRPTFTNR